MTTNLTRAEILAAPDLKTEEVPVSEWGGTVMVRAMSGAERDSFEQSLFTGELESRKFTGENVRAKLLVRCIVDENGVRIFKDEDADVLGQRSAAALDRLYAVAQRLSGIGKNDLDAAIKK